MLGGNGAWLNNVSPAFGQLRRCSFGNSVNKSAEVNDEDESVAKASDQASDHLDRRGPRGGPVLLDE